MKRSILLLPALAFVFLLVTSLVTTREERKKAFIQSCNQTGDQKYTDTVIRKIFHDYCECAGERVVSKLTEKDWRKVDSLQTRNHQDAISDMITPIIKPCLDELQKRYNAIKK